MVYAFNGCGGDGLVDRAAAVGGGYAGLGQWGAVKSNAAAVRAQEPDCLAAVNCKRHVIDRDNTVETLCHAFE